jgi:hypothetical protein
VCYFRYAPLVQLKRDSALEHRGAMNKPVYLTALPGLPNEPHAGLPPYVPHANHVCGKTCPYCGEVSCRESMPHGNHPDWLAFVAMQPDPNDPWGKGTLNMTKPCPICAEFRYISLVKVCPICGAGEATRGKGHRRRVFETVGESELPRDVGRDYSTRSRHGPAFLSSMLAARSRGTLQRLYGYRVAWRSFHRAVPRLHQILQGRRRVHHGDHRQSGKCAPIRTHTATLSRLKAQGVMLGRPRVKDSKSSRTTLWRRSTER